MRLWSALVLWVLLAALLSTADRRIAEWRGVSTERSSSQWQRFRIQLPTLADGVSFGYIVDDSSSLVDSAASWLRRAADRVSGAFWGFVDFLERSRRDFYSKINNLVLPARSSFRSPFGNSGATEPLAAVIPEPPTISHTHDLRERLYLAADKAIKAFSFYDRPGSCLSAVDGELPVLREMVKHELGAGVCGAAEVDHEFCKVFNIDKEMTVDMVFSILNVNPVDVVARHVEQKRHCHSEFGAGHWQKNALALGHMFHESNKFATAIVDSPEESYQHAASLSRLGQERVPLICKSTRCPDVLQACHLRKKHPNVFAALFSSTFRPWDIARGDTLAPRRLIRYRRAMLFPRMPVMGIQVYSDSRVVTTLVAFGTLSLDKPIERPVAVPQIRKRETDEPVIRMNAKSAGAAAM
ncbi:hypothetical protein SELMODRAFT_451632 [Selaginella moellendorffii]|uniref:Uncharacterized protein n=1 Tax=Selaginella moellendorffii TaxID=88036 RepID=D8SE74_SELML|nr:uncharacterized protein LOC9648328 [Selaginella moellendorffii]EFJ17159.1 hypothetical protein SELMODRAFT_451632 [Selaginella moellendorffii]|eukprot:XP_002981677.1 uncharacterized protein LOC9648328 [Selaginella moellendorffii]